MDNNPPSLVKARPHTFTTSVSKRSLLCQGERMSACKNIALRSLVSRLVHLFLGLEPSVVRFYL